MLTFMSFEPQLKKKIGLGNIFSLYLLVLNKKVNK